MDMCGSPKFAWLKALKNSARNCALPALSHLEILHETEIDVGPTGPGYDGPAGVPESVNPVLIVRRQERGREARVIEPMVDSVVGDVAITRPVRPLGIGSGDIGKVLAGHDSLGESRPGR